MKPTQASDLFLQLIKGAMKAGMFADFENLDTIREAQTVLHNCAIAIEKVEAEHSKNETTQN